MNQTLGKEYTGKAREIFLRDNCEEVVDKSYYKPFSKEELLQFKENLSDVSIKIDDIEKEAKESANMYKGQITPLKEDKKKLLADIKIKAEYVTEKAFKFVDEEERTVGFYNSEGDLIDQRPMLPQERQRNIFRIEDKTGTNN